MMASNAPSDTTPEAKPETAGRVSKLDKALADVNVALAEDDDDIRAAGGLVAPDLGWSEEDMGGEVSRLAAEVHYLRRKLADEISRREMTQRALEGLSRHDMLTMLPNRGLFDEHLTQALARRGADGKLAVMVLNLDRFRAINDVLGHTIGDLLLREVAQRLNGILREGDEAGRLGGDEFLVLLDPVGDAAEAVAVADKMIIAANKPYLLDGHTCAAGLSVGVAVAPDHGVDNETLIQNAHRAMAGAKESGRNTARAYEG